MKRKADFKMQNVAGEYLLVPLGGQMAVLNGFVAFNDTATFVWELLAEERSLDEMTTAVAERFGVTAEIALDDVRTFADKIKLLGLLES